MTDTLLIAIRKAQTPDQASETLDLLTYCLTKSQRLHVVFNTNHISDEYLKALICNQNYKDIEEWVDLDAAGIPADKKSVIVALIDQANSTDYQSEKTMQEKALA